MGLGETIALTPPHSHRENEGWGWGQCSSRPFKDQIDYPVSTHMIVSAGAARAQKPIVFATGILKGIGQNGDSRKVARFIHLSCQCENSGCDPAWITCGDVLRRWKDIPDVFGLDCAGRSERRGPGFVPSGSSRPARRCRANVSSGTGACGTDCSIRCPVDRSVSSRRTRHRYIQIARCASCVLSNLRSSYTHILSLYC